MKMLLLVPPYNVGEFNPACIDKRTSIDKDAEIFMYFFDY